MADAIAAIEEGLDPGCLVGRCRKNGCSLSLNEAPAPFVLIDMDREGAPGPGAGARKCDYIFIGQDDDGVMIVVAPLELKSGRPHASEIVPQLQSGAAVADGLIPRGEPVRFRPIAVYGGALKKAEIRRFRDKRHRVQFRGQHELVRLVRCGGTLRV